MVRPRFRRDGYRRAGYATATHPRHPGRAPGSVSLCPEHSLAAYELGIAQGADYIEPDLQITRDGVLIAHHDLTLERTTNVREVFPQRYRTEDRDGETVEIWPVNDFTLEEIRQLDAGSWFDASFADTRIPTLTEVIETARGRAGLFIETKAPEVYGELGFGMEQLLLEELVRHGLDQPDADPETPVIIQSFSAASLRLLRDQHGTRLPLALLISGDAAAAEWLTPEGLTAVAEFATGIGPAKRLLLDHPDVIDLAHQRGLTVVPWTFRASDPGGFATVTDEMAHFLFELRVDGIITDNPDLFPRTPPASGR